MKLIINNPCHENWDAMTPTEKGAFCGSCCKNVIDFSKKSLGQIKEFFSVLPETENVCGRFKEEQLTEISFGHFFKQFKKWQFLHKLAVILFFIFGTTLFSKAQNIPNKDFDIKMGKVAYIPKDTVKIKTDSVNKPHIKGKVKTVCAPEKVNKPDERHMMGEIMRADDEGRLMGQAAIIKDDKKKSKK